MNKKIRFIIIPDIDLSGKDRGYEIDLNFCTWKISNEKYEEVGPSPANLNKFSLILKDAGGHLHDYDHELVFSSVDVAGREIDRRNRQAIKNLLRSHFELRDRVEQLFKIHHDRQIKEANKKPWWICALFTKQ